ncbi:hypothetical protein PC112_g16019 [Phytophthora cactorum]|nr:hypothetical protein PC112_g16019 [Phytophthora cactorum]
MRAKDGRPVRYLPDDQPRWRRRYICTHVWPDHSRGKGERPQQMLRSTLFPFHFTTRVFTSKGRGTWRSVTHNHSLSREVYDNYSHNRQVPMKEPIVEDLHLMVKASGKCLRIYEYIRDHSAYRVTRRDVTNLMVTIRSVLRGEVDDDLAVDKFLLDIEQDDPGIVTSLDIKIMFMDDPLGDLAYVAGLSKSTPRLKEEKSFRTFTSVAVASHTQKDGHGCGLYEVNFMWRTLDKKIPSAYTDAELNKFRISVFRSLLGV